MSLLLEGKEFLSSREAAELFSYSSDYIARLCRNGEVNGRLVGRTWYAERGSLQGFISKAAEEERLRREDLRKQRLEEFQHTVAAHALQSTAGDVALGRYLLNAGRVAGALAGGVVAFGLAAIIGTTTFQIAHVPARVAEAATFIGSIPDAVSTTARSLQNVPFTLGPRLISLWEDRAILGEELFAEAIGFGNGVIDLYTTTGDTGLLATRILADASARAYLNIGSDIVSFTDSLRVTSGNLPQVVATKIIHYASGEEDISAQTAAAVQSVSGADPNIFSSLWNGLLSLIDRGISLFVFEPDATDDSTPFVIYEKESPQGATSTPVNWRTSTSVSSTPQPAPTPSSAPAYTSVQAPVNTTQYITYKGITKEELSGAITNLQNTFENRLSSFNQVIGNPIPYSPAPASGGVSNNISILNKIDKLSGVDITGGTITDATITGGSIDANAIAGVLSIGKGGTGTSTAPIYGELLVGDGAGNYSLMATSSLGISVTGTLSIANGGTGTTTAPVSQLLYGGTGGIYQSVATTTASCAGSASCTAFTIIGSTPVTISASSGGGSSGNVATSTNETAGHVPFWTTTAGTPALLGSDSNFFWNNTTKQLGLGTTTPQYVLTAYSAAGPQLSLSNGAGIAQWVQRNAGGNLYFATTTTDGTATSTLSALSIIGSSGTVGIGTSSPSLTGGVQGLVVAASGASQFGGIRIAAGNGYGYEWLVGTTNNIGLYNPATASYPFYVTSGNNIGIGTTTPSGLLSVNPNGITGASFAIGSTTSTHFWVSNGGNVGIGTSTIPSATILAVEHAAISADTQIAKFGASNSTAGSAYITIGGQGGSGSLNSSAGGYIGWDYTYGGLAINTHTAGGTAGGLFIKRNDNATAYIGIGTTTPQRPLTISGSASQLMLTDTSLTQNPWNFRSVNGTLYIATSSPTTFATSSAAALTLTVNGDLTVRGGIGKLTIGTLDPVYTVGGVSYSTYVSGMIGIKEEVTGTADIATPTVAPDGSHGYSYLIDFDSLPAGSDLWLFSQATNLRKHIDSLVVLLTSEGGTHVWYSIDKATRKVYLLSETPTKVSYRMTAPRFDTDKWTNYNHDGVQGFVLPEDTQTYFVDSGSFSFTATSTLTATVESLALKLDTLASTTAPSTPEMQSFVDAFFGNIFSRLQQWFAQAGNGIGDFFAGKVRTKEICVAKSDGSEFCATGDQLAAMAAAAGGSGSSGSGGGGDEGTPPDTEAPVITIHGNNPAEILIGDSYVDLGATVTDNVDQNLGIHTFVDGVEVQSVSIDTSAAGTYTILYRATDQAGNVGEATRTVTVSEPAP